MVDTIAARFWAKVERGGPDDCWLWTASVNNSGYGRIGSGGAFGPVVLAHRVAYELLVGEIPGGLELDHLCRNRRCVNPAHLEAVTHRENVRRAAAAKQQCSRGHPYTEANTYTRTNGVRSCRICRREWNRAYKARDRR